VGVSPEAIVIPVLLDLEEAPGGPSPGLGDVVLDSRQKEHLLEVWQTWDEFLVSMITALAQKPLTEADRQTLFEVLLETRYGLMEALEAPAGRTDFVRRQFVESWRRLSPVFRAHLSEGPTRSLLGYLAFFSASDALAALDRIGPTLGIEISRDGLLRLIRLLAGGRYVGLEYRPEVNASLRQTLGVGPPLDTTAPDYDEGDTGTRSGDRSAALARCFFNLGRRLQRGLVPSAWAAGAQSVPEQREIEAWVPDSQHFHSYFSRVRGLLKKSIESAFAASALNAYFHDLCLRIAPAIAWQESCMRQFETKDGQVIYLRSYNGTSVGIMQINERVWRGIYDREALRWNIAYNARAGCEIVTLYLQRFLLPKAAKEDPDLLLDEELTARTLHAMYNGGPGEFSRFLERHRRQQDYLSDRLFYEKYRWVVAGDWDNLRRCWGG
jgi:hypothetical protein